MDLKTERISAVEDDFFLNPDFAFGKEEKLQYFDDLKRKYLTLLETYEQVERQFGNVEGEFGYVDPDGVARVTKYTADRRGYRTRSFIIPKQVAEEEEGKI